MALVVLVPALAAGWQAIAKVGDLTVPDASALAHGRGCRARELRGGVGARRGACPWRLGEPAAWVAARNDVAINLAVIVMAGMTVVADSGWPDLVLGVIIVVVNAWAAVREVWELAEEERLAAKAVAGEPFD
jgi:hypothetical protein